MLRVLTDGDQVLTLREENILKIIVGDYISTATPVSSESIARRHGVGVSPATIRNEMAHLGEDGYITQPHPSAGRIPLDRGYRYYVGSLMEEVELSFWEQQMVRDQFHQVELELEEWTSLSAVMLSRLIRGLAVVTLPKAIQSRLRHLELISLQEFLAMLVLVFQEAKVRRQMLTFDDVMSQEELALIAGKLNAAYAGLTSRQIEGKELGLSLIEEQVMKVVVRMMSAEEQHEYEEPRIDGLCYLLSQPEFASAEKTVGIVEVLEDKGLLRSLLSQVLAADGVQVVIGGEIKQDILRDCSLIVSRYGAPGQIGGAIGIVGPTRIQYDRAIPAVRFLSGVMTEMVNEFYGPGA